MTAGFIRDGAVDVAVIIVTYNSAGDLGGLLESLRPEASSQRLRVIVADNSSSDATLDVARAHDDVVVMETGGNLGYAGGINAAMRLAGDADAVLVLNPDLVVKPGCITALRARLRSEGAGIVVPQILASDQSIYPSLRFEPSLLRATGDAFFGAVVKSRPAALSETAFHPSAYTTAHQIEWATGAALLISSAAARDVGDWDERFFLYSEETDFFRRVRAAGHSVWYDPAAVVRHTQGGSGSSLDLEKLMAVNRIRYARKHHRRLTAAAFRSIVALHEFVRSASPRHRAVLRTVLAERRSWAALPRAEQNRSA